MSNNTISKFTFKDLIGKYKIEIPIIQRDYAQGREGKEDLRKSFLDALLKAVEDKELELDFIYGSVKNEVLQPLDGQQRLTTLFLLHWYIAIKEDKLDNKVKTDLSNFSYETRTSSREFCNNFVKEGVNWSKEQKPSELIIDSPWFFLSWKKDPTIKSMLTMLDAIHEKFSDKENVWNRLDKINFHYIELQNFGVSDDLYIKMNARGKPLTEFENFKAKLEQLITNKNWEKGIENKEEKFSYKVDTKYTDLFWNYRDKSKNVFDQQFMNFFRTISLMDYVFRGKIKKDEYELKIEDLKKIVDDKYLYSLEAIDEDYFKFIRNLLNKISGETGVKKFLKDNSPYADEDELFKGAIANKLGYADMVKLFGLYLYLVSEKEKINEVKLSNWMRIVRNLVEGSRYWFNNVENFSNALRSINDLLKYRNEIDEHLSKREENLSGFIRVQVDEEKLKSKLILQSDDWKNAIINAENHGYFNGQIEFLLNWYEGEIDKFNKYAEKAKAIFDDDGLNFENFLFERALLATGDYLLDKGKNYSFVINNDRDISWKRLLRKDEKRKILKQLIDKLPSSSKGEIINKLQEIIDDFSNENDWRYYFVKQPEMIAACGSEKLIRWNSKFDILLLNTTTTSGYHKEYYSYSLYVEFKNKHELKDNEIEYIEGRYESWLKYFKYKEKEIAFISSSNGEEGKFVVLKDKSELKDEYGKQYTVEGLRGFIYENNEKNTSSGNRWKKFDRIEVIDYLIK